MKYGDRFRDSMTLMRRDRIRGGYRYTWMDRDGYKWYQDVADVKTAATVGKVDVSGLLMDLREKLQGAG